MAADSSPAGERIELPSVVELVAARLRALVVSGELAPGVRLVEERLAERFGISRPPLREALRVLQGEGLVTSLPRRGFVVATVDPDAVREIYTLRFALERLAVELGVPVTDPARIEPMRRALDAMGAAADTGDDVALVASNSDFHVALVGLAGHSRLDTAYAALGVQLRLCMAYNLRLRTELYGGRGDVRARHAELLDAVEAGDPELVLQLVADHGHRSLLD